MIDQHDKLEAAAPAWWGVLDDDGYAEIFFSKEIANDVAMKLPGSTVIALYAAPVDTAALAERVKTLEEALRPFAQCSEVYPGSDPDIEAGFAGVHDRRCPLTIGDYHRARKALGGSNE